MVKVTLHLKDGKKFEIPNAEIEESPLMLVVHESENEYTVIPMASINYYDVEVLFD
jgi:hypothetical protein